MLRVRDGDMQAAESLIRRNSDRVARYIARLIRTDRAADDLAQDVFLQVLAAAGRYEPTAKFTTWLYRIATNVAISHLNKRSVANLDMPEVADSHDDGPDDALSRDELRKTVASAISALPVNQRVALTLFQYEHLSYQQIANVMQVTVEAVRCLLTRARNKLRELLADLQ